MIKNIDPRKVKALYDVLNQYVYIDQINMTITINIPTSFINDEYDSDHYYHFVLDTDNTVIESEILEV